MARDLILPLHLKPIIQSFTEDHLRALARLEVIAGLITTIRAMPESAFEDREKQPVITPGLGLAIETMGILSAIMTLCSAEAEQHMQENPGTFGIDGAVAQGVPLLLWMTHGIHMTIRGSIGIPSPAMVTVIKLSQNRHTLERVCDAVDLMIHTLRQRFPHAIPPAPVNLSIN